MPLRLALPSVLASACFGLGLVGVAGVACALAVGGVEFVAAFGDGDDVVGFDGLAFAAWSADLALRVAREDLSAPCGLLCSCGPPDGRVFRPVHGYPPGMGYKEWRARLLERTDAMVERADARADAAQLKHESVKAEIAERRDTDVEDALQAWRLERAADLGVDHDALAASSERFGVPLPAPHRARGLERLANGLDSAVSAVPGSTVVRAAVAVDMASSGSMDSAHVEPVDPYQSWVNLVQVEERVAARVAAGERVPATDRAMLRMARWAYKRT